MTDPIQIGDFRIIKRLGAGGMGIVYIPAVVCLYFSLALFNRQIGGWFKPKSSTFADGNDLGLPILISLACTVLLR